MGIHGAVHDRAGNVKSCLFSILSQQTCRICIGLVSDCDLSTGPGPVDCMMDKWKSLSPWPAA